MSKAETASRPLYRGAQVVWYIVGIIETLLGFRFVLKFLAANPNADFTSFIYGWTQPLVQPFLSVFRTSRVEGSIIEWATLLAMVVYSIAASGIVKLLVMSRPVSTTEAAVKLEQQDQ